MAHASEVGQQAGVSREIGDKKMAMNLRGRLLAATVCAGALGALAWAPARAETLADRIRHRVYKGRPLMASVPVMDW